LLDGTTGVEPGAMDGLFVALGILGGVMIVAVAYLIAK
jgi:hypothetical protein